MTMNTGVTLINGSFVATLPDGRKIERRSLDELAEALVQLGVTSADIHTHWSGGDRMMTAGQRVALLAAVGQRERRLTALSLAA